MLVLSYILVLAWVFASAILTIPVGAFTLLIVLKDYQDVKSIDLANYGKFTQSTIHINYFSSYLRLNEDNIREIIHLQICPSDRLSYFRSLYIPLYIALFLLDLYIFDIVVL